VPVGVRKPESAFAYALARAGRLARGGMILVDPAFAAGRKTLIGRPPALGPGIILRQIAHPYRGAFGDRDCR
jgi:hypothetical protein